MTNKLIATDQNTIDLLKSYSTHNGRNYDVLIKIQGDQITAKTLMQLINDDTCRISHKIAYVSDIFPWVDHTHLRETVFKDWFAPSFYERFKAEGDTIVVEDLPKNVIPFDEYVSMAGRNIENNVRNVLESSNNLVLLYSGGIDSLLLLSYLMKYDKAKDVRIIHCSDSDRSNFDLEKKLGFDVENMIVPQDVAIEYANQSDPFKFRMCQDHWIAGQFRDSKVLMGYEGNSVLMHKWEWLKRLGRPVTDRDGYVTSCNDIDWGSDTDLRHHTISMIEPFSRSWSNVKDLGHMISPISDTELLRMLPFVDIRGMDPNFVGNAVMARTMIRNNVGDRLDRLITTEAATWSLPLMDRPIDVSKLDGRFLDVAIKRRVETDGMSEILRRITKAKTDGHIDFRSLLSLKYVNYFA